MSCNGCRVLRKGCNEGCALRPCLEWIERPEAQGFATLFLAKFFGRAGLLEFITAVPLSQRTALFQSLLYEACGRTVNPVYGAVGLLWSGKWHLCQEAVETVLNGGNLHSNVMCNHDTIAHNLSIINPNSIANMGSIGGSQTILPSRASHSSLFKVPSISFHAQSNQRPNVACKPSISTPSFHVRPNGACEPSISTPSFHAVEEKLSFNYAPKKHKISSENLDSRSLIFQSRPREGVIACNYTTNRMHQSNMVTSCSHTMVHQRSEPQFHKLMRHDMDTCSSTIANEEVHLALTLNSSKKRGVTSDHKEDIVNGRVSSPSEGSIVTSLGSPLLPSTSSHRLPKSPSSRTHQDVKLLNLLV